MHILLVPGLWLDGSSWEPVLDPLRAAGHAPRALTMPGLGARATEASGIGIRDWIDAVVDEIDGAAGDVVLVGHSGGGNVIWGAADARPDRMARAVFVDTVPPPDGFGINEFDAVDGLVPFPGWDFFPDEDVRDLDAAVRARTSALMRSVPARATSDPLRLADPRRFDVPVTLLMGGLDRSGVERALEQWGPYGEEFGRIRDAEVRTIGSGHWPQFSAPERLAELLVAAIA